MPGLTFSNELISRDEVCSHACYFDESAHASVNFEKVDKNFPKAKWQKIRMCKTWNVRNCKPPWKALNNGNVSYFCEIVYSKNQPEIFNWFLFYKNYGAMMKIQKKEFSPKNLKNKSCYSIL